MDNRIKSLTRTIKKRTVTELPKHNKAFSELKTFSEVENEPKDLG